MWSRAPGVTTATASPLCALPVKRPQHRRNDGPDRYAGTDRTAEYSAGTTVSPHLSHARGRRSALAWHASSPFGTDGGPVVGDALRACSVIPGRHFGPRAGRLPQQAPGRVLWDALPSRTPRWTRTRPRLGLAFQAVLVGRPVRESPGRSVNCRAAPLRARRAAWSHLMMRALYRYRITWGGRVQRRYLPYLPRALRERRR